MKRAIGIKLVPFDRDDAARSHFFGPPVIPGEWLEDFDDNVFFLGMIKLEEVRELDVEHRLPEKGYLYFFLEMHDTVYDMHPIVRYSAEEPTTMVTDFNVAFEKESGLRICKPIGMEFYATEEDAPGHKLLGLPYTWNHPDEPKTPILTIAFIDPELDVAPELDGYGYFFFGPADQPWEQAWFYGDMP